MNRWKTAAAALLVGLSTVAVASPAQAAFSTPCQAIIDQLNSVKDRAQAVNIVNVLFEGPRISQGIQQVTSTIADTDCDDSVNDNRNALNAAISAESNAVIAKQQLLRLFFFTEPIRQATLTLEAVTEGKLPHVDLAPIGNVIEVFS